MKIALMLCAILVSGSPALHATTVVDGNSVELVTTFSIASPTRIPGKTLKPGNYSIKVIDHLSDRIVLEVDEAKGKPVTRFLGLENAAIRGGSASGPIPYGTAHGDVALRGFAFPGGSATEFVYPKAEAVTIAKDSASRVPAIDPASEGRPDTKNLSKDDLQMVTLWTLSSTRVGPESASEPAIKAERYQRPTLTPVQSTRASAPAATPTPAPAPHLALQQAPAGSGLLSEQHASRLKSHVLLASLPHTGSNLPLIFLSGVLLLLAAGTRRLIRVAARAR